MADPPWKPPGTGAMPEPPTQSKEGLRATEAWSSLTLRLDRGAVQLADPSLKPPGKEGAKTNLRSLA